MLCSNPQVLTTYLKLGGGNACAGHISAKEVSADFVKLMLLNSVENVGFVLPIGSGHESETKKLIITNLPTVLR